MPRFVQFSEAERIAPAASAFEIAPDDEAGLPQPARAVYVGLGGDLKVVTLDGETVTFRSVPGGSLLPVQVQKVFAAGTTAGALVGLR